MLFISKVPEGRYVGKITTAPDPAKGFGFIDINSVTQENGRAHKLPMKDIFIHEQDCDTKLRLGLMLSFGLANDNTRGQGHYRAIGAIEFKEVELLPPGEEAIPGYSNSAAVREARKNLLDTIRHRINFHQYAKPVPKATVDQAVANDPLSGIEPSIGPLSDEEQRQILAQFLFLTFPMLSQFAADFNPVTADDAELDEAVRQSKADLAALGMDAQLPEFDEQVSSFKNIRSAMLMIFQEKLVRPDTFIPITQLPDLFTACPVWYYWVKQDDGVLVDTDWENTDPYIHPATQWFIDLFPNDRWADTFQMFNRRIRSLKQYKGDTLPPHVTRRMRRAVELFDYVVIMTPYHDVAGREWQDPNWIRLIDPYVIGFKKGLPYFFVLARFSDSGAFPLLHEMVADTMEYLRKNIRRLDGFNYVRSPYWGRAKSSSANCVTMLGTHLIEHTKQALSAFEQGELFDWLRGKDLTSADKSAPLN